MFPKIGGKPPKSSILIGISIINHPFWGTTIFGSFLCFAFFEIQRFKKTRLPFNGNLVVFLKNQDFPGIGLLDLLRLAHLTGKRRKTKCTPENERLEGPKMMGLGNGDSFEIWPFLVSMLNLWGVITR